MTTIDTRPGAADAAPGDAATGSALRSFLVGVANWITTTDHKRIGRLYTGFGLLSLVVTGLLGALLGLERVGAGLVDGDALLQLFQAYRTGLVFGVVIPLGLGLSISVAPLQLGARSIAFPRLALAGFYAWLGGISLTVTSLIRNGGIGGGDTDAVDLTLAGLGLMALGATVSAGSVATSVLTTRAPGMTMRRVPFFAWSALIGSLGILLSLPVFFGAIVYTLVDHRYGAQLNFGPAEGIAPWIGWILTTPAVVVFALPAVGIAAEMVPVAFRARQPMRGLVFGGIALVGVAALAAVTQQLVHDVTFDTDGATFFRDLLPFLVFAGLPLLGLVMVMGLGALTVRGGLSNGAPRVSGAFVMAFLGLAMVGAGLVGNLLASITDLELARTTFEEGAALYVVYGTALAALGGLAFWAPKLRGSSVSDGAAVPLAFLGVAGTVLAGLPLYIAGFLDLLGGIPANDLQVQALVTAYERVDQGELWLVLSLVGHLAVVVTVLAFVGLLLTGADETDENPVGGHTIEWSTASPAPPHNFEHVPTVASPEPLLDTADEGSPS